MSRFLFPTDAASEAYCLEIAQYMIVHFGISEEEAVSRINEQWQHTALLGEDDLVYHDTPDSWAKMIYYGGKEWFNGDRRLYNTLSKLEWKVDLALHHLGIRYGAPSRHVLRLMEQGDFAQASWLYRDEAIGSGTDAMRILKSIQVHSNQSHNTFPADQEEPEP